MKFGLYRYDKGLARYLLTDKKYEEGIPLVPPSLMFMVEDLSCGIDERFTDIHLPLIYWTMSGSRFRGPITTVYSIAEGKLKEALGDLWTCSNCWFPERGMAEERSWSAAFWDCTLYQWEPKEGLYKEVFHASEEVNVTDWENFVPSKNCYLRYRTSPPAPVGLAREEKR